MAYNDLTEAEQKSVKSNLQKVIACIAPSTNVTPEQAFNTIDRMVAERSILESVSKAEADATFPVVITNTMSRSSKRELECQLKKLQNLKNDEMYPNFIKVEK